MLEAIYENRLKSGKIDISPIQAIRYRLEKGSVY